MNQTVFFLKVDNWADNDALRQPTYRRSISEFPSSTANTTTTTTTSTVTATNINRRSLGGGGGGEIAQTTFPKTSSSMTDIQSSQQRSSLLEHFGGTLNKSASNVAATTDGATSNNLYTYIGISEPAVDRDKGHVYENQSVLVNNKSKKEKFDHKRHEAM